MLHWQDCYRADELEALASRRSRRPDADDEQAWLDLGELVARVMSAERSAMASRPAPHIQAQSVFNYWDEAQPPADVAACLATWRDAAPSVRTYSRESADAFLAAQFGGDVLAAFRYAHHPAMQADLFRLGRLLQGGGLYVDADDAFIGAGVLPAFGASAAAMPLAVSRASGKSLVPRIDDPDAAGAWYYLGNAPLFSVAGHRLVELALERAVATVSLRRLLGERCSIHRDTGPACLSMAALDYAVECFVADCPLDLSIAPGWTFLEQSRPLAYKATERNWRTDAVLYGRSELEV